nr:hypothetical protein 32 [Candidatus Omnitrophota bacterium]
MAKQKRNERPLTENQSEFMKIVQDYDNIADNGNLMSETGWGKKATVRIGMTLVKRGLLEYTTTDMGGFEGGIWKAKNRRNKK